MVPPGEERPNQSAMLSGGKSLEGISLRSRVQIESVSDVRMSDRETEEGDQVCILMMTGLCTSQCQSPWGMDNPGDSDSFLTSHPGGYDNCVQTQWQF